MATYFFQALQAVLYNLKSVIGVMSRVILGIVSDFGEVSFD